MPSSIGNSTIENRATSARELLEKRLQKLSDKGHEALLTTVGLAALGAEETQRLWQHREEIVNSARVRGADVEDDVVAAIRHAEQDLRERVAGIRTMKERMPEPSAIIISAANSLRQRIDAKLAQFEGQKGGQSVEPSYQEIEITPAVEADEADKGDEAKSIDGGILFAAPFGDYDSLTSKQIIAQLSGLTTKQLEDIQRYEAAHANRVTVLRAIERKLG